MNVICESAAKLVLYTDGAIHDLDGVRIGRHDLILTNVDAVYRGYGTGDQRAIRSMDLAEAQSLLSGGDLGTGSMRPKVEAAADFVRSGGRRAVIAALGDGLAALRGETGTTITAERA